MAHLSLFEQSRIFSNVWITFNCVCSILTLWLIRSMNLTINGYLFIIITLTIFQFLYDISFFVLFNCAVHNSTCAKSDSFSSVFSGLETSLWTCYLSYLCFYIIWTKKSIDINKWYPYFFGVSFVSSFLMAFFFSYFLDADEGSFDITLLVYTNIKLVIIPIIFVLYCLCLWEVKRLVKPWKRKSDPLYLLSNKLSYYPLVQVLSRLGPTWFNLAYKGDYTQFSDPSNHPGTIETISYFLSLITNPMCGSGYFLVFLLVQKGALDHFLNRINPSYYFSRSSDVGSSQQSLEQTRSYERPKQRERDPGTTERLPMLLNEANDEGNESESDDKSDGSSRNTSLTAFTTYTAFSLVNPISGKATIPSVPMNTNQETLPDLLASMVESDHLDYSYKSTASIRSIKQFVDMDEEELATEIELNFSSSRTNTGSNLTQ